MPVQEVAGLSSANVAFDDVGDGHEDDHTGDHADDHLGDQAGDHADDHADDHLDDGPTAPLLPPDDRLWRHPSEIASVGLPGGAVPAGPTAWPRPRRQWPASFLSGSIGALLVVGLVTAVGGFRTRTVAERSIERVVTGTNEFTAPGARLTDPLVAIADRVHPSIVSVRAQRADGTLNCSGFILRSDGYILTAQRTIEGARRVWVTMADASVRDAEIIGTDPDTGLGVVKIDGTGFTPASLSTAVSLRPGQSAVALGAPLVVAAGVVSTVGKSVQSKDSPLLFDMIELNANVDAPSSGGPVVDGQGGVIGVLDVLDGRGYATPIDIARDVADQLITTGKVEYGYLGVDGNDTDSTLASRLNIPGGAVVSDVADDSPAYLAGVHPGDVVVGIEDVQVRTMAALKYAVRSFRPGRAVTIRLLREGKPLAINATLTERPVKAEF